MRGSQLTSLPTALLPCAQMDQDRQQQSLELQGGGTWEQQQHQMQMWMHLMAHQAFHSLCHTAQHVMGGVGQLPLMVPSVNPGQQQQHLQPAGWSEPPPPGAGRGMQQLTAVGPPRLQGPQAGHSSQLHSTRGGFDLRG